MLAWITQNLALILLILLLLILLIWGIIKLVKYYRAHICDWAARRLAKCVPVGQCAPNPMYMQAKRCPQAQIGAASRPVVQYAAAPQCATVAAACSQAPVINAAGVPSKQNLRSNPAFVKAVEEAKKAILSAQATEYVEVEDASCFTKQ